MSARLIPAGEARELPDDEALRSLYDDFDVIDESATEPMPLELEPLPADKWLVKVRRTFGAAGGAR